MKKGQWVSVSHSRAMAEAQVLSANPGGEEDPAPSSASPDVVDDNVDILEPEEALTTDDVNMIQAEDVYGEEDVYDDVDPEDDLGLDEDAEAAAAAEAKAEAEAAEADAESDEEGGGGTETNNKELGIYALRLKVRVWSAVRRVAGAGGRQQIASENDKGDRDVDDADNEEKGGVNTNLPRHDPEGKIPIVYGGLMTRIGIVGTGGGMHAKIELVDVTGETEVYDGGPTKTQSKNASIRLSTRLNASVSHIFSAAAVVPEDEERHCYVRIDPIGTWIHEERVMDMLCPNTTREFFDRRVREVKDLIDEATTKGMSGEDGENGGGVQAVARPGGSLAGNAARRPTKCSYAKCPKTSFIDDYKSGNIVCETCGTIAQSNKILDAPWKLKYKNDDVDPSFHGPAPDHRYSSAHNLRTAIQSIRTFRTGTGDTSDQMQRRAAHQAFSLINAQNRVELNLSNFGMLSRAKTRQGYKDNMKSQVFEEIEDACTVLRLHGSVQDRAKDIYAHYRDNVAAMRQTDLIKAICIVLGLRGTLDSRHSRGLTTTVKGGKKRKRGEEKKQRDAPDDARTNTQLYRFPCKFCTERFNAKKAQRYHMKYECDKNPNKL